MTTVEKILPSGDKMKKTLCWISKNVILLIATCGMMLQAVTRCRVSVSQTSPHFDKPNFAFSSLLFQ